MMIMLIVAPVTTDTLQASTQMKLLSPINTASFPRERKVTCLFKLRQPPKDEASKTMRRSNGLKLPTQLTRFLDVCFEPKEIEQSSSVQTYVSSCIVSAQINQKTCVRSRHGTHGNSCNNKICITHFHHPFIYLARHPLHTINYAVPTERGLLSSFPCTSILIFATIKCPLLTLATKRILW
jgi:hypothetical protein